MPRERTGQIFIILASNIYSNTSGSSATLSYNWKDSLLRDLTVYPLIQVLRTPFSSVLCHLHTQLAQDS